MGLTDRPPNDIELVELELIPDERVRRLVKAYIKITDDLKHCLEERKLFLKDRSR